MTKLDLLLKASSVTGTITQSVCVTACARQRPRAPPHQASSTGMQEGWCAGPFAVIPIRRCRRPVHKLRRSHPSIIRTGHAPTSPLQVYVHRTSVTGRRCGALGWSGLVAAGARRSHPDRTPGPSRFSGATAGRGRFGAHGPAWCLSAGPEARPWLQRRRGTDGWFP
jgi:hypothetical protein